MKKTIALLLAFVLICCVFASAISEASGISVVESVDQIDIDTETARVRYTGFSYVPENFFALNAANKEKSIFLQFEYTNKTDVPTNFQTDFTLTVEQNAEPLDMLRAFSSKASEADVTAFKNFFGTEAVNETLPVYYPVIMKDYSPITITVTAVKEGHAQSMEQDINAPDGVIVPDKTDIQPAELVGSWIDPVTGDTLEIGEGTADTYTGIIKGEARYTPTNRLLNTYNPGGYYKLEGDLLKIAGENYRISKQNDKLYLTSQDTGTVFMLRKDFYRFEDIKIHTMGDTIATDAIEFTLTGYGYDDIILAEDLGGKVTLTHKEPFKPDNDMIWAKISYQLFNVSDQTIKLNAGKTNVRFFIVYRNKFTFDMETFSWNYITKGYGGDEHVEWFSSYTKTLEIPPLVSEKYDTWLPVSPAVREDAESSHILLVLLPTETGTELFAYDLSTAASVGQPHEETAEDSEDSLYGTWEIKEVKNTSTGKAITEADSGFITWKDWILVIPEDGNGYLQTDQTSAPSNPVVSGNSVTSGNMKWDLEDGRLTINFNGSILYYEKISNDQTIPSPTKKEIVDMFRGTWDFVPGSEHTGYIDFTGKYPVAVINGVLLETGYFDVNMQEKIINCFIQAPDKSLILTLNYTYENGQLSLNYSGDTLKKR